MKSKPNVSLLVGIAIPIAMIVFVAASIYLPGLFIQPTVNFVYMTGSNDSYACKQVYEVHGGTLMRVKPVSPYNDPTYIKQECNPIVYVYDVTKHESREITVEEAKKLKLDPSVISSDGFEVVHGNSGGDFLLFDIGRDYNSVYLKGHNVGRKIQLRQNSGYGYNYPEYQFLGWLLP